MDLNKPKTENKDEEKPIPAKKEEKTTRRRKKAQRFALPYASIKKKIAMVGDVRVEPKVVEMVIEYTTKVIRNLSLEAMKLAKEDKRKTLSSKDMEKVFRFSPYSQIAK